MSCDTNSSLEGSDAMYVNDVQKFFTYVGYYANSFAREAARDIERQNP